MPYGYQGKVAHVDLTRGSIEIEEPAEALYRKYMGGSAMGVHYLLKKTPPRVKPLGQTIPFVL
jgi:aldehyde:ferredoxin oxidoreductase